MEGKRMNGVAPGRCAGLDLSAGWCWTELTDGDDADRCAKPATCRYYNGLEWIPLCPEHYDL